MSLLQSWIQTPGAAALGKTLLHSLWEGTAVAIALAFALCCIRSSRARYAAACLAMLSLLGMFAFTLSQVMPPALPAGISIGRIPARAPVLPALDSLGSFVPRGAPDYVAWLVPFWIAGVVIFQVRSMSAWIAATRMRRTGVCPAQPFWQSRLDKLGTCLRISRPVQLLESCLIQVPVVIGHLRPVILMPVGLLAGLPARQVEAILLHELAHVCRYDFLANLCQFAVESLLFYHPAAWWISGVIRTERENCCDDLVVEVQGGANEYAHALAALEFNRGPRQALAVTGGNLVKRIRRLLVQPEPRPSALAPVVAAAILTLTVMTAMAWQSKPATPAPQAPRIPMVAQQKQGPAPAPRPQAQPQPASVETPYDKWLTEDVAYIVADEERLAFRRLQTAEEKEQFIEQFWEHRDPTPRTVDNEFKEEHYRRVAYANQRFTGSIAGWKTDRGRVYIQYGPPDEIESHPSGGTYQRPAEQGGGTTTTVPFEQWRYNWIEGVGANIIIEFVDPQRNGEYRQTVDPSEKDATRFFRAPDGRVGYFKTWPRSETGRAGTIHVTGQVNRPGAYSLTTPTTVLQALVNSGGFTSTADSKRIVVHRGSQSYSFNYDEVFRGVNPAQNIVLQPGDIIVVR